MKNLQFEGKVAIVTGAASGIGRASATRFAAEGARVIVADIDRKKGEETASEIRLAGGEAVFQFTDVAESASVREMVATAVDTFGRLDFAHNNAGVMGGSAPIVDLPEEVWARAIGVMLTGVFLCMKYEIPQMLKQGGGAIVNTSSGAGLVGFPGMADYVSSKHGVIGLTRTAALEYVKDGIRVNAICPGTTHSTMVDDWIGGDADTENGIADLHPIGRLAEASEVAAAAIWLCSEDASFMVGHSMPVDGGYSIQ